MTGVLQPGTPTSVGSLPHTDPREAADFVLRLLPELPAAPQLPRRSSTEGMLAQVAARMPGVSVQPDGSLTVDPPRLDPSPTESELDPAAWAGLFAFLEAAGRRRSPTVKLQLTGPVTLALALAAAGAPPPLAFGAAGAAVMSVGRALVKRASERLPGTRLVVVLDEPGLTAADRPGFPFDREATIDLISGALATLGADVVTGIHCCGSTDLRLVLHAGPELLSLPVDGRLGDDAGGLASFLDHGGWVAWGAVPTGGPIGDSDDPLWRRLMGLWSELIRGGCDPLRLRTQALVTPACGLAGHGHSQVERVLQLTRRIAERVQDQAVAGRMPAGT